MLEFEIATRRGALSLEVKGAFAAPWTVLCGPAGSGKTTLLRVLAGLEDAHSARVHLDGRYLTDTEIGLQIRPGPSARDVGLALQQTALFPHQTAAANVAYGLSGHTPAAIREVCQDLLELVGGSGLADRLPDSLSLAEAQQVSLARALAPAPRLLLLDEPLSALEPSARDLVLRRLHEALAERKMQVVLATRDRATAVTHADEVIGIEAGQLVSHRPAPEALAQEQKRLLQRLRELSD